MPASNLLLEEIETLNWLFAAIWLGVIIAQQAASSVILVQPLFV
jgi:hypothetical protein